MQAKWKSSRHVAVAWGVAIGLVAACGALYWSLVSFPFRTQMGTDSTPRIQETVIKLPYDTRLKGAQRLLPCCNVAVALQFFNASPDGQAQILKSGYFANAPYIEKGTAVSVRAFYAVHGDSVGQEILLFPTPERLTVGTAALVGTTDGRVGYVPALLAFPP